jgi:hypothetical protein
MVKFFETVYIGDGEKVLLVLLKVQMAIIDVRNPHPTLLV